MAQYILTNDVVAAGPQGVNTLHAGFILDTAQSNYTLAQLQAAGGIFVAVGNDLATGLAAIFTALRNKGNVGAYNAGVQPVMAPASATVPGSMSAADKTAFDALVAGGVTSLQCGTTTLSSGVSPAIAATITENSRIVGFLKDPANGALTVKFAALSANRSVGAPGSFKITALIAAGTINTADTSTVDWVVFN